jgi:hypothetical protein
MRKLINIFIIFILIIGGSSTYNRVLLAAEPSDLDIFLSCYKKLAVGDCAKANFADFDESVDYFIGDVEYAQLDGLVNYDSNYDDVIENESDFINRNPTVDDATFAELLTTYDLNNNGSIEYRLESSSIVLEQKPDYTINKITISPGTNYENGPKQGQIFNGLINVFYYNNGNYTDFVNDVVQINIEVLDGVTREAIPWKCGLCDYPLNIGQQNVKLLSPGTEASANFNVEDLYLKSDKLIVKAWVDKASILSELNENNNFIEQEFAIPEGNNSSNNNYTQRPDPNYTLEQITDKINTKIIYNGRKVYTDKPSILPVGFMIKADSDPKSYLVLPDGTLRWVETEAVANRIFGPLWDNYILWLDEALVYTYNFGEVISE